MSRTTPAPGDAKRREPQPVLRKEGRKTLTQTGWDHSSQRAVRSQGCFGKHSPEPEGQGKLIKENMSVLSLKEDWGYDRVGRKNIPCRRNKAIICIFNCTNIFIYVYVHIHN